MDILYNRLSKKKCNINLYNRLGNKNEKLHIHVAGKPKAMITTAMLIYPKCHYMYLLPGFLENSQTVM